MAGQKHPEFAARLKSARLRSGKSQERIAAEVGTSRRHWIRWEHGENLPTPDFMERIGEATGQPDLFAGEDDDEASSSPLARDLASVLQAELRRQVAAALAGVGRI